MEAPARREPADIPAETQLQRENERLRAELAAANRLKHAVLQRCDTLRKQLGSARLAASAPYSAPPTKATEACASASHLSEETPRKRRRPASPGRGVTPAPASPEPLTSAKSQSISSPAPAIVAPVATPSQPPLPPRAPPLSAPSQMRGRSVWEGSAAATLMTPPRGHTPFTFTLFLWHTHAYNRTCTLYRNGLDGAQSTSMGVRLCGATLLARLRNNAHATRPRAVT